MRVWEKIPGASLMRVRLAKHAWLKYETEKRVVSKGSPFLISAHFIWALPK